jgi:hypothetical protein
VALPNVTNGYRLTVRGITPKHGTEYLLGRSDRHQGDHLQSAGNGLRYSRIPILSGHPGEAVVRLVPLSGDAADFASYRDLLNRKLAGELRMIVEVVDRIATTPRGKRKFVDQRLDLLRALADPRGKAPLATSAVAEALS